VPGVEDSDNCISGSEQCDNIINYCPPGYGVEVSEPCDGIWHGKSSIKDRKKYCRERYSTIGKMHCDYPEKGQNCIDGNTCVKR
jgi:hypothetical protein